MPASSSSAATAARSYELALEGAGANKADAASSAGAQLCVALYRPVAYDLSVAPMALPRLSINLRSVPVAGSIGGTREREYSGRRYSLFFTPAGIPAHWRKRAPSRHLNIYFQPRVFEDLLDGRCAAFLDHPLMDLQRAPVRPYVDALERAIMRDEPFARDASTNLALLILAELAAAPARAAPVLSASAVATVRDYVAANLDTPIRVADLAAVVRLSPGRFAAAFRAATGRPPHRYVLMQRVTVALELLRTGKLDLSEVALACGFASQQHMTTTVRRVAGTTPARVRRMFDAPGVNFMRPGPELHCGATVEISH
jgi:AraC family transcriptional regulator